MSLEAELMGLVATIGQDIHALNTGKQATLVSGENIKTVNGQSLLGSGDIEIAGGADLAQMHAVALSF